MQSDLYIGRAHACFGWCSTCALLARPPTLSLPLVCMAAGPTSSIVHGPAEQSTLSFYLAVPAAAMRAPNQVFPQPIAGDSLPKHFDGLISKSLRPGVAFVPLTTSPEAAVTFAESCARGQNKRLHWTPSVPLEHRTTDCAPPHHKKQKSRQAHRHDCMVPWEPGSTGSDGEGLAGDSAAFDAGVLPSKVLDTDFCIKVLRLTPEQFQTLNQADKLLKPPRGTMWMDHLQFFNDLTLPTTAVKLPDGLLNLPVEVYFATPALKCGPPEVAWSQERLLLNRDELRVKAWSEEVKQSASKSLKVIQDKIKALSEDREPEEE